MVMPLINDEKTLAAAGAGTEEGRRPTIVSAPAAASPELLDRPRRRTFTGQDKLRILGEVERAAGVPGGIGAIMRREGLYSSALSDWRRQRDAGAHPVAVLNHNKPAFYMLEPKLFEAMLEKLADLDLAELVASRLALKDRAIEVDIDEV